MPRHRRLDLVAIGLTLLAPSAPASPSITPAELMAVADIATLTLSPDGAQVAYITREAVLERNGYDCAVYVQSTKSGSSPRKLGPVPVQVSMGGGFVPATLKWAQGGRTLTYLANFDGIQQVWAWDIAGGSPRCLTHAATDVVAQAILPDGETLFCTTLAVNAPVALQAERERSARDDGMLFSPEVAWGDYLGDRGIRRYVTRQAGIRYEYWKSPIDSGTMIPVSPEELAQFPMGPPGTEEIDRYRIYEAGARQLPERATLYEANTSPDGRRTVLLMKEHKAQRETIIVVGDAKGQNRREWYRALEAGISSLHWDRTAEHLYFYQHRYTDTGFVNGIYRLKEGQSRPEVVYETDTEAIERLCFDTAGEAAAFLGSTANQPDRVVMLDLRTGDRRVLFDPNPSWAERQIPPPHILAWKNKYGVRAFGCLVEPFNRTPGTQYPLVVVPYRAKGFLRGSLCDEYPIYPFASAGFAVLALDIGEAYISASEGSDFQLFARYWSALATLEEAVKAAGAFDFVDSSRRALTGWSLGADTGWFALEHSTLFQAAIFSDHSNDPFALFLRGYAELNGPEFWHAFAVPLVTPEDERRWKEVGMACNAAQVRAPVLVNDSDHEFAWGLQAYNTLRGLGKPFEMHIYPDAGHIIGPPRQRFSIYQRNLDWLRFWLQGFEDRTPAKTEQYMRWRKLREQQQWNEQTLAQGRDPGEEFARQSRALMRGAKVEIPAPLLRK